MSKQTVRTTTTVIDHDDDEDNRRRWRPVLLQTIRGRLLVLLGCFLGFALISNVLQSVSVTELIFIPLIIQALCRHRRQGRYL